MYEKHHEWATQLAVGLRNEQFGDNEQYLELDEQKFRYINLSLSYLKQYTWRNKYGFGVDIGIDEFSGISNYYDHLGKPHTDKRDKLSDQIIIGTFATYEFTIDRLSVVSYLGAYLWRVDYARKPPLLYQRFGLKYHLKNNLFMAMYVKAHKCTKADVLEWSIGYRLVRKN